jgi:hypothetical protein
MKHGGKPRAFEDGMDQIPPSRSIASRYAYGLGVKPP